MPHFKVGQCSFTSGTPIHDVLTLVNQALAEQLDERCAYGSGETFIQCETFTGPINGAAQFLNSFCNQIPRVLFPFPCFLLKRLTTDFETVDVLLRKLSLHHKLCRDPGMIGSR